MSLLRWRALLFVPADSERLVRSAVRHRPDAVILDLEDGVGASGKAQARAALRSHQALLREAGIAVVVRVNADLPRMLADIEVLDPAGLAAILVPKCTDTRRLLNAAELLEAHAGVGQASAALVALVESPAALPQLDAIASVPGLAGIMFGPEDYAAELGVPPDGGALDVPATLVAAACAARRIAAIGLAGSLANFRDLDAYAAKVTRARALGFHAAAAIHPAQLPVLRAGFSPSPEEIAWARRALDSFEAAGTSGRGVAALDGEMLDAPVIERARRLLARAEG